MIPFTAAAAGTLTDALPGMGVAGAPGTNGINGISGANGANGSNGTNGAAGATGPAGPVSFVTNAQSTTYQVQVSDFASCKAIPVASGTFTITLVASPSQPASGQCILILNYGSGSVTIARSGQTINGSTASQVLTAGSASAPTGLLVISDGTNYEAQPLGGTGTGGSGGTAGPVGPAGPAGPSGPVSLAANPQTSTYQTVSGDFASCKSIPVASGTFTITLLPSSSQPASGQCILILNYGAGVVTVAHSGQTLNGGSGSLTLAAGSSTAPTGLLVISDGTNYVAQPLGGSGGGGGGSVSTSPYNPLSLPANLGSWTPYGGGTTVPTVTTVNGGEFLVSVVSSANSGYGQYIPVSGSWTHTIAITLTGLNAQENAQYVGAMVTDGTRYNGLFMREIQPVLILRKSFGDNLHQRRRRVHLIVALQQ